jgi:CheY-like chemotaxis protein
MQGWHPLASAGVVARKRERLRILVIDDQAGVRAFVCVMLESLGHEADSAEDGPTGLALLPQQRYDLIITDLRMPGISGWDVVQTVRQQVRGMPFIVMSGFLTEDDVARAAEAGVSLLHKPFQRAEMERAIQQATRNPFARPRAATVCPVCSGPLSVGGSLLPQGDGIVHARCWREVPALAKAAEPKLGTDPPEEEDPT